MSARLYVNMVAELGRLEERIERQEVKLARAATTLIDLRRQRKRLQARVNKAEARGTLKICSACGNVAHAEPTPDCSWGSTEAAS